MADSIRARTRILTIFQRIFAEEFSRAANFSLEAAPLQVLNLTRVYVCLSVRRSAHFRELIEISPGMGDGPGGLTLCTNNPHLRAKPRGDLFAGPVPRGALFWPRSWRSGIMIRRTNDRTTIDPATRRFIRSKVRKLVGRHGFTRSDRDDLEQELLLRLLKCLPQFDPDQGCNAAFDVMVVQRSVANIVRERKAAKRDYRRVTSLNVVIADNGDGGPTELGDTIARREQDARRCRAPRRPEELAQLVGDMAEIIGQLPTDLRELAEALKTQSVAEIARQKGVARTTLYGDIGKLRRRFEDVGLKDYL